MVDGVAGADATGVAAVAGVNDTAICEQSTDRAEVAQAQEVSGRDSPHVPIGEAALEQRLHAPIDGGVRITYMRLSLLLCLMRTSLPLEESHVPPADAITVEGWRWRWRCACRLRSQRDG